jgi:Mitochondrial protein Pet127
MPVAEFDFNALKAFTPPSKDPALLSISQSHNKKYVGSSSSMTGILSHLHYLLSGWRAINPATMSQSFPIASRSFTALQRGPAAIILNKKGENYAIDADKEFDSATILSMLGKSMEKLLTVPTDDFERYRKSDPREVTFEERNDPESFHYSTYGDFLMRSQLDAWDPRLPGTGMFDLKTRSVVAIRHDPDGYEEGQGYEIKNLRGEWESFEREYYDMIRAAFLKYSLQVRMGRMDGIFVAFHNTARIFGFQYISLPEMDVSIHGSSDTTLGDQEFRVSLELMNQVFDRATKRFPDKSIRIHFETRDTQTPFTYIFAEPLEEEDVLKIQNNNKAKVEAFERKILGLVNEDGEADAADIVEGVTGKAGDQGGEQWENIKEKVEEEMDADAGSVVFEDAAEQSAELKIAARRVTIRLQQRELWVLRGSLEPGSPEYKKVKSQLKAVRQELKELPLLIELAPKYDALTSTVFDLVEIRKSGESDPAKIEEVHQRLGALQQEILELEQRHYENLKAKITSESKDTSVSPTGFTQGDDGPPRALEETDFDGSRGQGEEVERDGAMAATDADGGQDDTEGVEEDGEDGTEEDEDEEADEDGEEDEEDEEEDEENEEDEEDDDIEDENEQDEEIEDEDGNEQDEGNEEEETTEQDENSQEARDNEADEAVEDVDEGLYDPYFPKIPPPAQVNLVVSSGKEKPLPELHFDEGDTRNADVDWLKQVAKEANPDKELLAMTLTIRNKVNGSYVVRPIDLNEGDEWKVEYSLADIATSTRAWSLYDACQARRKKTLDKEEGESFGGDIFKKTLKALCEKGRDWRQDIDAEDAKVPAKTLDPFEITNKERPDFAKTGEKTTELYVKALQKLKEEEKIEKEKEGEKFPEGRENVIISPQWSAGRK